MTKEKTPVDVQWVQQEEAAVNCKQRRAGWCLAHRGVKCSHRVITSMGHECKSVID